MIYEFALSPATCKDYKDVRLFLSSFGRTEGRLLSDIPKRQWKRLAFQEINRSGCGPVERKRLKGAVLKFIRKALYKRHVVPNVSSDSWLDHALAAHNDRNFRAILSEGSDGSNACILMNDHTLVDQELWNIPVDLTVQRTAGYMLDCIRPMIDCASEVILIDRHFDPDKYRFRQFLFSFAQHLSQRSYSPAIKKIDYHIGDRISDDQLRLLCKQKVVAKLPDGIRISFTVWPWDELHDRYVLTDVGGVEFGIGLDIYDGSGPKEVRVSRISSQTLKRWWQGCKQQRLTFTIP